MVKPHSGCRTEHTLRDNNTSMQFAFLAPMSLTSLLIETCYPHPLAPTVRKGTHIYLPKHQSAEVSVYHPTHTFQSDVRDILRRHIDPQLHHLLIWSYTLLGEAIAASMWQSKLLISLSILTRVRCIWIGGGEWGVRGEWQNTRSVKVHGPCWVMYMHCVLLSVY